MGCGYLYELASLLLVCGNGEIQLGFCHGFGIVPFIEQPYLHYFTITLILTPAHMGRQEIKWKSKRKITWTPQTLGVYTSFGVQVVSIERKNENKTPGKYYTIGECL